MRRVPLLIASMLLASAAQAQDTTVVVVRHLPAAQDTAVVVRHLSPDSAASNTRRPAARRMSPPMGAPYGTRYPARNNSGWVIAKDPNMGSMLSFIFPGGGQYYAGASKKGAIITLLAIGAPIVGYANVHRERSDFFEPQTFACPSFGCSPQFRDRTDWTPAAVGLTVGIGAWLYGVATARSDVAKWNRAHGVRFTAAPGRVGFAVPIR